MPDNTGNEALNKTGASQEVPVTTSETEKPAGEHVHHHHHHDDDEDDSCTSPRPCCGG